MIVETKRIVSGHRYIVGIEFNIFFIVLVILFSITTFFEYKGKEHEDIYLSCH